MKKVIALVLSCGMLLGGCTQADTTSQVTSKDLQTPVSTQIIDQQASESIENINSIKNNQENEGKSSLAIDFTGLDDQNLHQYIEDTIYNELVDSIDNDKYFVENIDVAYISQEYINELSYNSQANIYFGYTLEEVNEVFEGESYVFTLGEEGETIVTLFEEYDDIYEQILKNVAIGTGVILVCVTVSVISGGVGAPAVSMIFATSAKSATMLAVSSASIEGVAEGIITGIETGSMDEAIKAAALQGSEGFKWGAIAGSIKGGYSQYGKLKGATLKGLTLNEAAVIQKESKLPVDVVKQFHSMEEYNVLKSANLKVQTIDGKNALIKTDIDLKLKDELGRTNLERMKNGLAAIDKYGNSHELHHIGQEMNSPLAILTKQEHQQNTKVLHGLKEVTEINRKEFDKEKKAFWKEIAKILEGEGV